MSEMAENQPTPALLAEPRVTAPRLTNGVVAAIGSACLVLGLIAQRTLDTGLTARSGLVLYALAAAAFGRLMRGVALERPSTQSEVVPLSLSSALPGLVVAALGCLDLGGNTFRPLGTLLWLGGLAWTMVRLARRGPELPLTQRLRTAWREGRIRVPLYLVLLAAVVLVGAWFRLDRLNEIPADLGPDLIYHYYDTLDILQGRYRVHFPERESLLYYLNAVVARFVGLTPFSILLTSALIGIVTHLALFALGSELYGPWVGLLAAALLAVNRWHIALSRSGYPAVFTPLVTILVLHALIQALHKRRPIDLAWCGLLLGAGFYTYTPFKVMPLFVLVAVALYGLSRGKAVLRGIVPQLALMFLIALVVAAPLIRFAIERPNEYFVRELVARRLQREQAANSPGLPTYVWRTLLGLNWRGDGTPRWNYPGARQMGWISGALMVLGLGVALARWKRGDNVLLLSAWFFLLLPAALGMLPNDSPNSLRMSGMLGPAVLLAALPLAALAGVLRGVGPAAVEVPQRNTYHLTIESAVRRLDWHWSPESFRPWRTLLIAATVILLALEAREAQRFYFVDFVSRAPDRANFSNAREIARVIQSYGDLNSVYVKAWEFWFDDKALRVNLGLTDEAWRPYFNVLDPAQPPLSLVDQRALFILHAQDVQGLSDLRGQFPHCVAMAYRYPDGAVSFYAVMVER